MPVTFKRNQYKGVNAHLHSFIQHDKTDTWCQFYRVFLVELARALGRELPKRYRVRMEQSIQGKPDPRVGKAVTGNPEP